MKSLIEYITEHNNRILPNSLINTLKAMLLDWDKNFKAYWSFYLIYNILVQACWGKNAQILETAYDENGKYIEYKDTLITIKAGRNLLKFVEGNYKQIEIYENDKYLGLFGTVGYDNEYSFSKNLIEILQESNNFKIKEYKYSDRQFKKDLGFSPKEYDIDYEIKMYDVNSWTIVSGCIFKSNEKSSSVRNNLTFNFVYPSDSNFEPAYICYGAGLHGSKDKYAGNDHSKFKETILKIIENHI